MQDAGAPPSQKLYHGYGGAVNSSSTTRKVQSELKQPQDQLED